jgi:prenylcysteine oxidase/farnesylcysteine lyase
MSRKLRVGAALCVFGSLQSFSAVRANPLDCTHPHQLFRKDQKVCNRPQDPATFRVAVIGAGAAGSSSAWWLHLASDRLGHPIEVEVFERADYIGGRT